MSAQFGKFNFDGKPATPEDLREVRPALAPYGPDGEGQICQGSVAILYRAFHTTNEAVNEVQPLTLPAGTILTFDGRLDNRQELIELLHWRNPALAADSYLVGAAYDAWGTACFSRLIGDWALSLWDPATQSVVLAKDAIGCRHLYYVLSRDEIIWSSTLDLLVRPPYRRFALNEEYVAGWFSFFPAAHLTPYADIHAVEPSTWVRIQNGRRVICKYWTFDPRKRLKRMSDGEYEEAFRAAFAQTVRRRLRSSFPVLAELSGGMDSSSIVCVADLLLDENHAENVRLDTVSYFNDTEPNWNERPYVTAVEQKRGRTGCHIEVGKESRLASISDESLAVTPFSISSPSATGNAFAECVAQNSNRVLLSGIGGDEVCGGVPTPVPELADLLVGGNLSQLARQLMQWALARRQPWPYLLAETMRAFLPVVFSDPLPKSSQAWLTADFVRRNREAIQGYPVRFRFSRALPSFQANVSTLNLLQRQMACVSVSISPLYEKRYPYLDRDLLEFMYSVPREQLVRPGQRRSLMRRALIGIVPETVLNRRRKAYVVRSAMASLSRRSLEILDHGDPLISATLGIVDSVALRRSVRAALNGQEAPVVTLLRTFGIEVWLRNIERSFGRIEFATRAGNSSATGNLSAEKSKGKEVKPNALCET